MPPKNQSNTLATNQLKIYGTTRTICDKKHFLFIFQTDPKPETVFSGEILIRNNFSSPEGFECLQDLKRYPEHARRQISDNHRSKSTQSSGVNSRANMQIQSRL